MNDFGDPTSRVQLAIGTVQRSIVTCACAIGIIGTVSQPRLLILAAALVFGWTQIGGA
jgi:hypothetical protein